MIVLLHKGKAQFLLSGVEYDVCGNVVSGYVENGHWKFVVKDGVEYAYDHNYKKPVNKWPAILYEIIDVKGVKGDYNDVMRWAELESVYNTLKD